MVLGETVSAKRARPRMEALGLECGHGSPLEIRLSLPRVILPNMVALCQMVWAFVVVPKIFVCWDLASLSRGRG